MKPTKQMTDIADALLRWQGLSHFGADDVLIWFRDPSASHSKITVALSGDALKITRYAFQGPDGTGMMRNRDYHLDLSLQRSLGLPAETRGGHPNMQTMPSDDAQVQEVLDGIASCVDEVLGESEQTKATLMPHEGYPWSPENDPTPYYSAKKHKVLVGKKPEYAIQVDQPNHKGLGANLCMIAPRLDGCNAGGVVASVSGLPDPFLVTHCSSALERTTDPIETASVIKGCGGLLYPSIAISQVPATNFGTLVLVADVGLVLASMKPYKKRGRWPVTVYATDAWTATTSTFVGEAAMQVFEELHGEAEYLYNPHFWVLGPPVRDDRTIVVDSTKKMASLLKKRFKHWTRDLDAKGLEEVKERMGPDEPGWYSWLEAKANGIVSMACFRVAVAPRDQAVAAKRFLKAVGFDGDLLVIDEITGPTGRDARWDYSWRVRDAVLDHASKVVELAT